MFTPSCESTKFSWKILEIEFFSMKKTIWLIFHVILKYLNSLNKGGFFFPHQFVLIGNFTFLKLVILTYEILKKKKKMGFIINQMRFLVVKIKLFYCPGANSHLFFYVLEAKMASDILGRFAGKKGALFCKSNVSKIISKSITRMIFILDSASKIRYLFVFALTRFTEVRNPADLSGCPHHSISQDKTQKLNISFQQLPELNCLVSVLISCVQFFL